MIRRIAVAVVTVLVLSSTAAAQDTGGAGQPLRVPQGATLFVLDKQGVEHRGSFVRFDDQEIVMHVDDGERRFRRDVIARIERAGDSLKNGAIAGAVVGGLLGLLTAALQAENVGEGMVGVAISTGFYTAIGIGMAAAVSGRTVVYRSWPGAPGRPGATTALAFSLRW